MPQRYLEAQADAEAHLVGAGCMDCLHLNHLVEGTCEAFPERIPEEFLQDRIPHDRPYPGDGGLQFERAQGLLR